MVIEMSYAKVTCVANGNLSSTVSVADFKGNKVILALTGLTSADEQAHLSMFGEFNDCDITMVSLAAWLELVFSSLSINAEKGEVLIWLESADKVSSSSMPRFEMPYSKLVWKNHTENLKENATNAYDK